MTEITLTMPDDWHCHLRDNYYLTRTVPDTASRFQRAIIMPNLKSPVTTVDSAKEYRARILAALPIGYDFQPLMTLYLHESMQPKIMQSAKDSGIIFACKLYPSGATTHSAAGIKNIQNIYPLLEAMQHADLPLLIHGEVVDPDVDIFDREAVFIDQQLKPLIEHFPNLRIVLEHITSKHAVQFVEAASSNVAATITPQHLLLDRNDLLVDGIKPHYYCLPILKQQEDRKALVQAAISANPKFFLGTDSAPHSRSQKESACGCAGIYSAHCAIEIYAELFDRHYALDKLENFSSYFGALFYQLPINHSTITLEKYAWKVPHTLSFGSEEVIPLLAGETINWRIKNL